MKSSDVTIQMKDLCRTVAFRYLFCKMLQNEICKLGQNLPLATFGSERVNDLART